MPPIGEMLQSLRSFSSKHLKASRALLAPIFAFVLLIACSVENDVAGHDKDGRLWHFTCAASSDADWVFGASVSGGTSADYIQVDVLDANGDVLSSTQSTGGTVSVDVNSVDGAASVTVTASQGGVGTSTSYTIPQ